MQLCLLLTSQNRYKFAQERPPSHTRTHIYIIYKIWDIDMRLLSNKYIFVSYEYTLQVDISHTIEYKQIHNSSMNEWIVPANRM